MPDQKPKTFQGFMEDKIREISAGIMRSHLNRWHQELGTDKMKASSADTWKEGYNQGHREGRKAGWEECKKYIDENVKFLYPGRKLYE